MSIIKNQSFIKGEFAIDVGMANNSTLWAVSGDATAKGTALKYATYDRLNPFAPLTWKTACDDIQAERIAGDANTDDAYVVTTGGQIVHVTRAGISTPISNKSYGSARDIGVGKNAIWMITNKASPGGATAAYCTDIKTNIWYTVTASGVRISSR